MIKMVELSHFGIEPQDNDDKDSMSQKWVSFSLWVKWRRELFMDHALNLTTWIACFEEGVVESRFINDQFQDFHVGWVWGLWVSGFSCGMSLRIVAFRTVTRWSFMDHALDLMTWIAHFEEGVVESRFSHDRDEFQDFHVGWVWGLWASGFSCRMSLRIIAVRTVTSW